MLNEMQWKEWLSEHSTEVLETAGIREGVVVADFGCGSGSYTIPAARLTGGSGKVYALDQDQTALDKVQTKAATAGLRHVETVLSLSQSIDFVDGSVDLVLFHDVLHLIDQRATLFDSAYRTLKPGGRVSIHPMHVDSTKVSRQMQESGFVLVDRAYEGKILVFQKPGETHE